MTIEQLKKNPDKRVVICLSLDAINEVKHGKKSVYMASFSDNNDEIVGIINTKAPVADYYSLVGEVVLVKGRFEVDENGKEQFTVSSIASDANAVIDDGAEETLPCEEENAVTNEIVLSDDAKCIRMYEKLKEIVIERHSKLLNVRKTVDGGILAQEIENAPVRVLEALKALRLEPTHEDALLAACVCAYAIVARLYLDGNSFVEDEKDCGLGAGFIGSILARKVGEQIKADIPDAYDLLALNRVEKELLSIDFESKIDGRVIQISFPGLIKVSLMKGGVI